MQVKDQDIIICVDIALIKTGIAVMSGMKIIHGEVLLVKESLDYFSKLDHIHTFFSEFFDKIFSMKPASVELVLEGRLKRGFSGATLASIEGARVTTYHAFHASVNKHKNYEQKVFVYSPDLVKSFFTGRGNASKEAMLKAANSRFSSLSKIKFQEDVYDAIYLGIYHLEGNGNRRKRKSISRANSHSGRSSKADAKPGNRSRKA